MRAAYNTIDYAVDYQSYLEHGGSCSLKPNQTSLKIHIQFERQDTFVKISKADLALPAARFDRIGCFRSHPGLFSKNKMQQ